MRSKQKFRQILIWKRRIPARGPCGAVTFYSPCVLRELTSFQFSFPHMSKQKYVVVDWRLWGLDVQSSLKIIVPDPFNVNERNECSFQGTHPTTKRPMLFKGKILAVFGKFNNVFHFTLIMFLTASVWEICFV